MTDSLSLADGTASDPNRSARPSGPAQDSATSGLLPAKVQVPELPAGYLPRASVLERRAGLLERRLTVLQAPAGFGKTTVLADLVRQRKLQGAVAAWVSLDEDDTPNLLGGYLAYAFEQAGLARGLLGTHDAWSPPPAVQLLGMLAHAIERHETSCLLVLDEVDRLPRRTLQLVQLLLRRAPRNLHLALALRVNPGLELAKHVFEGGAVVVDAEALRFTKKDIARFLGETLSQRQLATVEERTAGWPFALRVYRNTRAAEPELLDADLARVTADYIAQSLLRDLSGEDRACLLKLSVFDWIDADLVDAVLEARDTRLRVLALQPLRGLLPPVDGNHRIRRLHPLVRDYCLDVLAVEDPAEKRSLHRRIAQELARRGQLTPSWRHASATGDPRLVGELMEGFGVFQLWLREGVTPVISAGRFLTPKLSALYPRLELLACIILSMSSKRAEAAARFEAVSHRTAGFTRDRDDGDAEALAFDGVFTRAALAGGADGLLPVELESLLPADGPAAVGNERGRALSCARHTLLCAVHYQRAGFEQSRRHGLQALAQFPEEMRFGKVVVNTFLGMAAVAQGRVPEAGRRYRLARQLVRKSFSSDPCLAAAADVLTLELDLERNREKAILQRTLKNLMEVRGVWADLHAAALAVSAELTFAQYDHKAAFRLLARVVDDLEETSVASVSKVAAALLAYYLADVGLADEAGRTWRERGLPCGVAEMLDIERQSWRTMEVLCCSRVRLLAEQGEFHAAEELASSLCAVASRHGLTRTLLRGLALSMLVAHRAGQPERAMERLVDFLRAVRGTDYTRPLVRHHTVSRSILQRLLAEDLDADLRMAAESMLATVAGSPATGDALSFSTRELEVLAEAGRGLRNKEIAQRLGITDQGVRYHLKSIYRKTGAGNRQDAVRAARSRGILS